MIEPKRENHNVGVIVARFQVSGMTEAHVELIDEVLASHPRVIIYLGISPVRNSFNNPLDFQTRRQMVMESYPHSKYPNLHIGFIKDVPDDFLWSKNLDNLIQQELGPSDTVVLYGGRDSFLTSYHGKFPTRELVSDRYISGTAIREKLHEAPHSSAEFRAGVVWSTAQRYPTVYSAVDIALYDEAQNRLLLGRKSDEKLYRFIGGFADPEKDDSFEASAVRELLEESKLSCDKESLIYLGSKKQDDWRYKKEKDCIITHLYVAPYSFGAPEANDDVAEVRWWDLNKIKEADIVASHRGLFKMFTNYLANKLNKK